MSLFFKVFFWLLLKFIRHSDAGSWKLVLILSIIFWRQMWGIYVENASCAALIDFIDLKLLNHRKSSWTFQNILWWASQKKLFLVCPRDGYSRYSCVFINRWIKNNFAEITSTLNKDPKIWKDTITFFIFEIIGWNWEIMQ